MLSKEMTRTPAASAPAETTLPYSTPAGGIVVELDKIVSKSHQKSRLRRGLHRVGGAFARLLERAVPAQAPRVDPGLPPEIRFPFF